LFLAHPAHITLVITATKSAHGESVLIGIKTSLPEATTSTGGKRKKHSRSDQSAQRVQVQTNPSGRGIDMRRPHRIWRPLPLAAAPRCSEYLGRARHGAMPRGRPGKLRDMTEGEEKCATKIRSAFASLTCLASPVNGDMLEQTPSPFGLPSPGAGLFRQGRELCLYLVGSGDLHAVAPAILRAPTRRRPVGCRSKV